ncbi:hypothetical protein DFQ27_007533, partial [Actinomortierella ambigua]
MPSTSAFLAADHQHHHHYHHYSSDDHAAASPSQLYSLSPSTPPPLPNRLALRERRRDPQLEHPISVHPHLIPASLPTLSSNELSTASGPTTTATATAATATATANANANAAGGNGSETNPSDLVQHCLLFPTYATRHSRS